MKVTIWEHPKKGLDTASSNKVDAMFMILPYTRKAMNRIHKSERIIGDWHFIPGNEYTEIGYNELTSAGFEWYNGQPLVYVGQLYDYLLFEKKEGHPDPPEEKYKAIYYGLTAFTGVSYLHYVNHAGAGRIIHLARQKKKASENQLSLF